MEPTVLPDGDTVEYGADGHATMQVDDADDEFIAISGRTVRSAAASE